MRFENTDFPEHSLRCTQALLAELICVEFKEIGHTTLSLNKHHPFICLSHSKKPTGTQKKIKFLWGWQYVPCTLLNALNYFLKAYSVLVSRGMWVLVVPHCQWMDGPGQLVKKLRDGRSHFSLI